MAIESEWSYGYAVLYADDTYDNTYSYGYPWQWYDEYEAAGEFQPAWARNSNIIMQPGVC